MKYIIIWIALSYATTNKETGLVFATLPPQPEWLRVTSIKEDRTFKIIEGRKEAYHFYDSLKVISKGHYTESGAFVNDKPLVQIDTILQLK